jgi:hypothetical protein
MTLPPLMSRLGAKFSHEVQSASVFHALKSVPTSATTVWIVIKSMPSIRWALTPRMRSSSAARSKAGWLPLGLLERRRLATVRGGRLRGRRGRRGRRGGFPGGKGGHVLFELSVAFGHLLAVEIVGRSGLLQFE